MYAVIQTGGKQYKVAENDIIVVEKFNIHAVAGGLKQGRHGVSVKSKFF